MPKKIPPKVENLKRFMEHRGLKAHPWAVRAGIRSSTLYNLLAGRSDTLSTTTLEKLAKAAGATVDEILGGRPAAPERAAVSVTSAIGIYGRLFDLETPESAPRPVGVAADADIVAAKVDGDGLRPIPGGWLVFYERKPRDPSELLGKLAVVKVHGQARQMVREIRRGSVAGLYTLLSWTAAPMEDCEIEAAHFIVSVSQPLA